MAINAITLPIHHTLLSPNAARFAAHEKSNDTSLPVSNAGDGVEISDKSQSAFTDAKDIMSRYDLRNISPREMISLSSELYSKDLISFQEHVLISFQSDLNPDQYQQVSKRPAQPERQRDVIHEWEENLEAQKASGAPRAFIEQTTHIVALLKHLNSIS